MEIDFTDEGYVLFNGERWAASSQLALEKNQQVQVQEINHLTLVFAPALNATTKEQDNDFII
ncbi:NfeD family protein [Colwellia sp. C1TZA3]|uniref:NfeD family protein n=1 Tax=Colwellia sp. C1TZA3 TaxID=2508879 RepID=UPI00174C8EC0|nr:NfeD family protein [Colwellia sp. C1TZA3]